MTKSRRAKFRRWLKNGPPRRAPLNERRAFGAFKTNEIRRAKTKLGIKKTDKIKKYETVTSHGLMQEFELNESLDRFADTAWLSKLAQFIFDYFKRKKGKVGFFRLKLRVSGRLSYVTVDSGDLDELVDKWVGSRRFTDLESATTSVFELAAKLDEELRDRGPNDGYIAMLHVYTVRPK